MALGEEMFEETGKITSMSVESVHPVEGVKMKVTFISEIKGSGKVPSGRNMGSGTVTQYPHGVTDAEYRGVFTSEANEQFYWWAHEKSKVSEGGKMKGLVMVSGYTNSKNLAWMNNLILAIESMTDPVAHEFRGIAYEWK